MAVPAARNLAPVPTFPERGRQVYETTLTSNPTRGRSDGRVVDPVLAFEPEDPSFGDEAEYGQAGR